ncbi:McrB family protein [Quadrisphaera setariae]|nr:AAA family ATPase [Quadrisphaera setariae]
MPAPERAAVAEYVRERRELFGPEFVPGRLRPEAEARALLDAKAGRMSKDDAAALGAACNRHQRGSVQMRNRFSPAFFGGWLNVVTADLDLFNRRVEELWQGSEEDALALLDQVCKTPSTFPGAGRVLPTMLLYLRDPERFPVWITATATGLAVLDGGRVIGQQSALPGYREFAERVATLRAEHGLAAQEVDAVLARAQQHFAKQDPPSPPRSAASGATTSGAPGPEAAMEISEAVAPEDLDEWIELLSDPRKRQMVFYGPPGTGKTWVARRLADHLAGHSSRVTTVQFHPAYSYEDFVEGLRPEVGRGATAGQFSYVVRPGVFRQACDAARADRDHTHVVLVDEMNRADLAAAFGELLVLLEYRDELSVRLPYSQDDFSVPSNLVLLATMNTADRSLALVDFALRRRFHTVEVRPDRGVLEHHVAGQPADARALVLDLFDLVQDAVGRDAPGAPGHSFWMAPDTSAAGLARVWRYQLRPYLQEHWFERPEQLVALEERVERLLGEQS